MKKASSASDETRGRGSWRRPLFVAAAIFLFAVAAYYLGYVWWGRKAYISDPFASPTWQSRARERVSKLWDPLREWEWRRHCRRMARECSGAWALADGRRVTLEMKPEGTFHIRSESLPELNLDGNWSARFVWPHDYHVFLEEGSPEWILLGLSFKKVKLNATDQPVYGLSISQTKDDGSGGTITEPVPLMEDPGGDVFYQVGE